MLSRLFRTALLLVASTAAATSFAQVKLYLALPAVATAGGTVDTLVGSYFPSGTISPANVSVSLAATCNGSPVVSVTPYGVAAMPALFSEIAFPVPSTLQPGTYAVALQGTTDSGTAFSTSNCATLLVQQRNNFVKVEKGVLQLNGRPFRFSGANLAGLKSSAHADTDQMLALAAANQFQVLRLWSFVDIGNQDGSNSTAGLENGYYFQYWNGSAPAFNDGANGLQNLDYAVYHAGQQGFKVILALTNNWQPGGGMDQYVRWAGDTYHDQFYTDPKIRTWYEGWVSHLLNHVNTYTGKAYKDDPSIMAWELANEPRCQTDDGNFPTSSACTTSTLANWVTNESAYIKAIDHKHLVSVGDEGFFCVPGSNDSTNGCSSGDDAAAFAASPAVDLVTLHLYSQTSSTDANFGVDFVNQHIALGKSLGKPFYIGEYGLTTGNQRNTIYHQWQQNVLNNPGAAGMLVWSLAGGNPGPIAAENATALDLHQGAPLLETIRNDAQEAAAGHALSFPPVADHQWAVTTLNTATTLNPLQNVVAYNGASVSAATINLNPGGTAQQAVHVYGGQFATSGATVSFTPDSNFNGQAVAPFNVRDSKGLLSNTAYLFATVTPTQDVPWEIESFETGPDGWQATGTTTAMSTLNATNGPHSLQVNVTQSGWFGIQFSSPLNLINRPQLSIDITNTGAAASSDIVIQAGTNWQWCQSSAWPWLPTGAAVTMTMPLTAAGTGCANVDLSEVRSIFIYLQAGNTYYIDNVRAAAVPTNLLPIPIASFEGGTQGWTGPGTVAQTSAFYTDGQSGLQVNSNGGWFGANNLGTLDLSSKSGIAYDIDTPTNGTSVNMQLVWGPNNTVCTGNNWGWANSSISTQTIPFSSLNCSPDLTQVHGVWLFFSSGSYFIDNVRAQ